MKAQKGESHRLQRVEREIREVIGTYLLSGFRGTLPAIVSISRVIVSADLRQAKVLVTAMGFGEEKADHRAVIAELKAHGHEVQHYVNAKLRMKFCPRLTFIYDEGFENAMKVENILRELQRKREQEARAQGEQAGGPGGEQSMTGAVSSTESDQDE